MNTLFVIGYALLGYITLVAIMEALVWRLQPDMEGGVVITTTDKTGDSVDRKLYGFEFNDKLYISSNHWLRSWYYRALKNPNVEVVVGGVQRSYTAVPIQGDEREVLSEAYKMGFVLRFICGFAPSRFLRLDPVASEV